MIHVKVTADDIAAGVAGDCARCPVALALVRSTGDNEVLIYERDWELWIEVWGRHILAPHNVREFIRAFDRQPRTDDGHLDTDQLGCIPPGPFKFELPDIQDPKWQERCYYCEELFDPEELDDEGVCDDCRKDKET
jgi:hypothetical protein